MNEYWREDYRLYNLYNLISVQRSTPSSTLVTISRPLSFSSLKITNRSFHTSIGINILTLFASLQIMIIPLYTFTYQFICFIIASFSFYYSLLTFFTPSLKPILFINPFHLRLVLFSTGLTLDTQNPRSMVIPFNFSFLVSCPVIFKYFKLHYRGQRWHKIIRVFAKTLSSVATWRRVCVTM